MVPPQLHHSTIRQLNSSPTSAAVLHVQNKPQDNPNRSRQSASPFPNETSSLLMGDMFIRFYYQAGAQHTDLMANVIAFQSTLLRVHLLTGCTNQASGFGMRSVYESGSNKRLHADLPWSHVMLRRAGKRHCRESDISLAQDQRSTFGSYPRSNLQIHLRKTQNHRASIQDG